MKFWSVEEPLTWKPLVFTNPTFATLALSSVVEASPETARLVVVALVVVELAAVKLVRVDEAVERKPFRNASVVEVACSPEPSLVKGKPKLEPAAGQEVRQSPVKHNVLAAKVVEVAFVVVAFCAVKF